jgi:hypothetical protein
MRRLRFGDAVAKASSTESAVEGMQFGSSLFADRRH